MPKASLKNKILVDLSKGAYVGTLEFFTQQ